MVRMVGKAQMGGLPLQQQIANGLRARIEAGELQPGDEVPTLATVAEQWGCTTATAQTALSTLKQEGLITGGRGKPATVRVPPKRVRLSSGDHQRQKDLVRRPEVERAVTGAIEITTGTQIADTEFSARYETVSASSDLAAVFGLAEGAQLLRRTYTTADRATRHLLLWSVSHIPVALIEENPDLMDQSKEPWPGGHQHQLYTVGIEVDRFEKSLIAVQSSPLDRDLWGMDAGVALLKVRTMSVDTEERVVEVSEATYPADRAEVAWTERMARWQ